jgi:hypothetical protein
MSSEAPKFKPDYIAKREAYIKLLGDPLIDPDFHGKMMKLFERGYEDFSTNK